MPRFVLSTVGISLLTNQATPEWRGRLNEAANAKDNLSPDLDAQARALALQAAERLHQGNVQQNRQMSAELNGLYALYDNQLARGHGDMHYLVTTDTILGRLAATVVQDYLSEQRLSVDLYYPHEFTCGSPRQFSQGIKALIGWCEETIPTYRQRGYEVIFNLTGGFKSLQGYLNIVGMFYADQIAYIFETGSQLLSIPRLPLRVDTDALREYRVELALMAQGHIYAWDQVAGVPAGLLEMDEKNNATLSDWGALIWNRVRQELMGDDLLAFPRLQYTDPFRKDFKQANPNQRAELQETLAKVASLLEAYHGDTAALKRDGGLQYEVYAGQKTHDGRPVGHFRVSGGRRVSCTEEHGALRLRRYGDHSINDHP